VLSLGTVTVKTRAEPVQIWRLDSLPNGCLLPAVRYYLVAEQASPVRMALLIENLTEFWPSVAALADSITPLLLDRDKPDQANSAGSPVRAAGI
jgi:hypothetical protein